MTATSAGDKNSSENTNLQSAMLKPLTRSSSGDATLGLRGRGCASAAWAMGKDAAAGIGNEARCDCEGAACEVTGEALPVVASMLPLGTRLSGLLGCCGMGLAAQLACEGNAGRSDVGLCS